VNSVSVTPDNSTRGLVSLTGSSPYGLTSIWDGSFHNMCHVYKQDIKENAIKIVETFLVGRSPPTYRQKRSLSMEHPGVSLVL